MRSNKLIVFEGIDGSGKQTQAALLAKHLRKEKKTMTVFSFPRYDTAIGKLIHDALAGKLGNPLALPPSVTSALHLLGYSAAKGEIEKALKKGHVSCDRHVPSTLAYDSAKLRGAEADAFVRFLERVAYRELKLPKPDVVVYLDIPVFVAQRLIAGKKKDRYERSIPYQSRVAKAYRKLARRENWRRPSVRRTSGTHE